MELTMFQETVVYVEQEYIPIKPLCDYFQINYQWQLKVIRKDAILKTSGRKNCPQSGFGNKKWRMCLTKKGFVRWIQLINVQLVPENLREKLISYQVMIFDYLYGTIEGKDKTAVTYTRIKKLRNLHNKIGAEIQRCEREVRSYIQGHFSNQPSLFQNEQSAN